MRCIKTESFIGSKSGAATFIASGTIHVGNSLVQEGGGVIPWEDFVIPREIVGMALEDAKKGETLRVGYFMFFEDNPEGE